MIMQQYKKTHVFEQTAPERLVAQTVARGQGQVAECGALCVLTGRFTGRSPGDKYIVSDALTDHHVDWNHFHQPIPEAGFVSLWNRVLDHLEKQPEIWARNMYACADAAFRLPIRIVTETPWANLFAANLLIEPEPQELEHFFPSWQVLHAPSFLAVPDKDGTKNENFVMISFHYKVILIGGTAYTGEIKKSIFTVLNFLLPAQKGVLTMHCSANEGEAGDVALFFGLSGTGKTSLSADPSRKLIGDDEHGWGEDGVFNIEGGCYAKIINLSREHEPDIYNAIRSGALVENTLPDEEGRIDFCDQSVTENTRASYPMHYIARSKKPSCGRHPQHIFFLACDAYGVLPPVSKLTKEQAAFYFLNGYTAKVAGTEVGITEPKVTFSAGFGAPFLPLNPEFYARMLFKKLERHKTEVWLVNTGWSGGPYGTGSRMPIAYTRAMIRAVLAGTIGNTFKEHPVFGLQVPDHCPGVPDDMLDPVKTWQDAAGYEQAALHLKGLFEKNFEKFSCTAT